MKPEGIRRVLVTGARLPASLEIARALASRGLEVYTADTTRFGFAAKSRSVRGYIRLPSPVLDYKGFRAAVIKSVNDFKIDLVIPVSEEIFFLAKFADEIPVFASSFDLLKKLHSKVGFQEFTIETPPTKLVHNRAELDAFADASDVVIKQEFSRGALKALIKPKDLSQVTYPAVAQSFIAGKELCTYSIAREGQILAHAAYEPTYRYGHGASVYFRSVEDDRLLKFVSDYVARTHFTGQIAFDVIVKGDQLFALECNPRATSGVHMLSPDQIADAFLGTAKTAAIARAGTARSAKLTLLMTNLVSPKDFFKARDTSFSWRDPMPFLSQIASGLELAYRSWKWKMTAGAAFGYDIEWNGASFE